MEKEVSISEISGILTLEADNDPNILMKLRSLDIFSFRNFFNLRNNIL